jgi:penicillin-binding protein 1A
VVRFQKIQTLPQSSVLLAADGTLLSCVHDENRISVPLCEVSAPVLRALIAVEDRRFFFHAGVDLRAIARAAYKNLRAFRVVQGGSTITQQLARAAILRRADRTVHRKILEMLVALSLEREFTKLQILEAYLNAAYFGHNIYGIELAALTFCGKHAVALDETDAAYLIGLLKAPARYCRCCNPEKAMQRTSLVLQLSGQRTGIISSGYFQRSSRRRPSHADSLPLTSGYSSQFVRLWLRKHLPAKYPTQPLKVHTTIDPHCQLVLELALAEVRRIGYVGRLACVLQDTRSGAVKALSGGVNFQDQEFNAATDGRLQPGSLLKPFILLAAFEAGVPLNQRYQSRPLDIRFKYGRPWIVRNAGDRYRGWMTVSDALIVSDNTVYVQLLLEIGIDRVRRLLDAVGISCENATPALATGSIRPGVSPLQICSAYSVFSAGGTFFPNTMIKWIADESGTRVWEDRPSPVTICSSTSAGAVSEVLRRVNSEGTGVLPVPRPGLAAKTGTSSSGGWHVSFDDAHRLLTWTESDFFPVGISQYPHKAVSAKALSSRIWRLLARPKLGFSELFSLFAGVDSMSVRDLLWMEDQFQST